MNVKTKNKKVAVVLFNLGGPDSKNAIRPFLMNFFMDKNIIRVPIPLRCLIASAIARKRTKCEAGQSYHELGDKSPLLDNSKAQAQALELKLKDKAKAGLNYKTFVCMRYWHPMAPQIVREVRDWGADEVIIMPLYPQFSTTTTWSSYEQWTKAAFEAGFECPTSMICCYPKESGFIKASASLVKKEYQKALKEAEKKKLKKPRVLFSAHGLPESVIKQGDPYQWQCEKTAAEIAFAMEIKELDWQICYQSRVGPKKWIGPSTEEALEKAAHDNVPVVIYPHAFTQEHVETLVEIEIEYREEAKKMGVPLFYRVPTVSTQKAFITGLADMVATRTGQNKIAANIDRRLCPKEFGDCCLDKIDKTQKRSL